MESVEARASGYWYGDEPRDRTGVDALNALRRYRSAESEMRRRTRTALRLNETDMLALRYVVNAARDDRDVSSKDLAGYLGISSASTTVLVDRLVASGHMNRSKHPRDGRAVVLTVTPNTHQEMRTAFGDMHIRMMDVARGLSSHDAGVVSAFLDSMTEAVNAPVDGGNIAR
ncbi:MarR family transcriptional regulator [Agreia sp. COWG]|uniref:MarR family transcriptional regulator n=1 Tax=Agreia sp. COWG TaxID=2773266 RepID=UPI001925BD8B|nr:MarR family transcriptional regulator [Agreia sp. COWG]CAD5990885.1 MarR family protein [Agreia sp. COWG]